MRPRLSIIKYIVCLAFFGLLYFLLTYKLVFLAHSNLGIIVKIYTILTGIFLFSRFILSYYYDDDHSQKYEKGDYPTVSFVIACKNEEASIAKTIKTCFKSNYPGKFDCIAVNDGSTDNTLAEMKKCKKLFGNKLKIISFEKNLGKREGMSEGVLHSKAEIIVFVDSDSFVDTSSLKHIVEHFMTDPNVGAVSGNTLVENVDSNALTKMQSARYGTSFDIFKASESVFGTVTCCPGCFSAYRHESIMKVIDRWRNQTFLGTRSTYGDDRSLTNFVLRTNKVVYCRKAIATTIVPEKYKVFFKQQLRWKKSWIREGTNAGSFIWKKHPLASVSFYTNLLIPLAGPFILARVFFYDFLTNHDSPFLFIFGVVAMSLLFGLYYYLIRPNKYWWYVGYFTLLYTFILVWQMPYAILKVRDTKWGTR